MPDVSPFRTGAALLPLPQRQVLDLVGPDARRWANGQLTNNVRALPVGRLNQHAMVDDKARVQGFVDVWCLGDAHLCVVTEDVTPEAFAARYEKYIIFDDVELTDVSADWAVLALQGPATGAVLAAAGLPDPGAEGAFVEVDGLRVGRRARCRAGGVEILVPAGGVDALAARLVAAGAVPVDAEAAEVARVEAGYPRWPVDMGEKALPHELRVVERMCNFEKGCYIGQEVVNRIDVMGQVTRKLWGLELAVRPPPGSVVRLDGNEVGVTRSAVQDGDRVRVLAMLRKAAWTPGLTVQVDGAGPAQVVDLPFPGGPAAPPA